MTKITELQDKRARIWKQAKDFLDAEQKESDVLSAEDNATYEKMEQDVVNLGKEIDRRHKQEEIEAALNQPTSQAITNTPADGTLSNKQTGYTKDFWQMMRGRGVVNTLKEGADPDGGFLVPDEFENQLIQKLQEANVLRTISHVIQTNSGEHKIPVVASEGTAAWLDEEAAYTESNTRFSQVSLAAHKLGTLIKVSEELLNDSAFDLMAYLSDEFGRRLGNAEEQAFLTGTGTNQPTGILTDTNGTSAGSTAAKTDTLTFDDLIDLFYSLKAPYRQNAVFLMSDDTIKTIRKLKDKNDQYVWQPSVQAGQPDRILNCPVYTSPYMPNLAAGNKPILFRRFQLLLDCRSPRTNFQAS